MYFFTADLHLGHKNICRYTNRPFSSVHEMNKELTSACNKTVSKTDTLAILGDLTMNQKKIPEYLLKLNGKKIYIPGNHDKRAAHFISCWEKENNQKLVEVISPLLTQNFNNQVITLCHYAMRVWDRSHYGTIQLFGHSHGTLPSIGKQLDVGVDNAYELLGEYRPFSLEEVIFFTNQEKESI